MRSTKLFFSRCQHRINNSTINFVIPEGEREGFSERNCGEQGREGVRDNVSLPKEEQILINLFHLTSKKHESECLRLSGRVHNSVKDDKLNGYLTESFWN